VSNDTGVGAEPLRRVFTAGGAAATSACPPADRLWAGAARALDGAESETLLDHIATCGPCSDAWRIAVDVQRDEALALPRRAVAPFRPRHLWTPWAWAAGIAASAVLVIHLAVPRTPAPVPSSDAGPIRGAHAGGPVGLVEDGATLPRESCVLRWSETGAGAQYFVRVLDERMTVVTRGEWLDRPEFTVPPEALARVQPGARLFWQVESRASDGTRRASPLYSFRIR
jgi:hypothetical protein